MNDLTFGLGLGFIFGFIFAIGLGLITSMMEDAREQKREDQIRRDAKAWYEKNRKPAEEKLA